MRLTKQNALLPCDFRPYDDTHTNKTTEGIARQTDSKNQTFFKDRHVKKHQTADPGRLERHSKVQINSVFTCNDICMITSL